MNEIVHSSDELLSFHKTKICFIKNWKYHIVYRMLGNTLSTCLFPTNPAGPCRHGVYPESHEAGTLIAARCSTGTTTGRRAWLTGSDLHLCLLEPGCVFNQWLTYWLSHCVSSCWKQRVKKKKKTSWQGGRRDGTHHCYRAMANLQIGFIFSANRIKSTLCDALWEDRNACNGSSILFWDPQRQKPTLAEEPYQVPQDACNNLHPNIQLNPTCLCSALGRCHEAASHKEINSDFDSTAILYYALRKWCASQK